MQMLTTSPAFNPFHVHLSNKRYDVCRFVFYKADGAVIETCSGWFGYNNKIRNGLEVPDVLLRRKAKFDGQTFAMLEKKYEKFAAVLYIPFGFFDFEQTEKVEYRGWYELHYHVYTSRKNPNVMVEDRANQWEIVKEDIKAEAIRAFDLLAKARKEVERLERECSELDPWGKMRGDYETCGILKKD